MASLTLPHSSSQMDGPFQDIELLKSRPAHMTVFMRYVFSQLLDPNPLVSACSSYAVCLCINHSSMRVCLYDFLTRVLLLLMQLFYLSVEAYLGSSPKDARSLAPQICSHFLDHDAVSVSSTHTHNPSTGVAAFLNSLLYDCRCVFVFSR